MTKPNTLRPWKGSGSSVSIIAKITDALGAATDVVFNVTVEEQKNLDISESMQLVDQKLQEADVQTFSVMAQVLFF